MPEIEYEESLVARLPEEVERLVYLGKFSKATEIIEKYLKMEPDKHLKLRLIYEKERINRLIKDYPYTREDALKLLKNSVRDFRDEELDLFLKNYEIDTLLIEEDVRFFSRFVDNIFFLNEELRSRRLEECDRAETRKYVDSAIERMIRTKERKKYRVVAGIEIKINVAEEDEYSVWLPFPKEKYPISDVRLVEAFPSEYIISSNDVPQRTIFFKSSSKTYRVLFEYFVEEQINQIEADSVEKEFDIENIYLEEKPPHIVFTPYLRRLAENLVNGESNPYLKAKKIYDWITKKIRYSYVREYSTYENIPEFVASSLRGDCGMQALLFITLCRIVGVPAKWQSGWFVSPHRASPHDWAQIYIEPYGWLPVDLSFGNARRNNEIFREFYLGSLDAFRMISNDDIQSNFDPKKRYLRSDPVDNQRGEIETLQRNIYYDQFDYKLLVREFTEVI